MMLGVFLVTLMGSASSLSANQSTVKGDLFSRIGRLFFAGREKSLVPTVPENRIDTPLHAAAEKGRMDEVMWYLMNGAHVNAQNLLGYTPLHNAVRNGHGTIARFLIDQGAPIDTKDHMGHTPLHEAARNGHEIIARFLIDQGAPIDARDNVGHTPLHEAVRMRKQTTVTVLIEYGAPIDARDRWNKSPIDNEQLPIIENAIVRQELTKIGKLPREIIDIIIDMAFFQKAAK